MKISLNDSQKLIISFAAGFIVLFFIAWIMYGGDIFTKTSVVVEVKDELFGTTYQKRVDKFVLGLDYVLAATGITALLTGILLITYKTKKGVQTNETSN